MMEERLRLVQQSAASPPVPVGYSNPKRTDGEARPRLAKRARVLPSERRALRPREIDVERHHSGQSPTTLRRRSLSRGDLWQPAGGRGEPDTEYSIHRVKRRARRALGLGVSLPQVMRTQFQARKVLDESGMAQHESVARIEALYQNEWSGKCHNQTHPTRTQVVTPVGIFVAIRMK